MKNGKRIGEQEFYPVAGADICQIGVMLFEEVTLKQGENELKIETKNFSLKNKHVQKVVRKAVRSLNCTGWNIAF